MTDITSQRYTAFLRWRKSREYNYPYNTEPMTVGAVLYPSYFKLPVRELSSLTLVTYRCKRLG
nr:hypothetical protein SYMBAF_50055 [Serratia symbiotica]